MYMGLIGRLAGTLRNCPKIKSVNIRRTRGSPLRKNTSCRGERPKPEATKPVRCCCKVKTGAAIGVKNPCHRLVRENDKKFAKQLLPLNFRHSKMVLPVELFGKFGRTL